MEQLVGVCFFTLLLVGLAALIYGSQKPTAPKSRRFWQVTGLAIEGTAFLLYGLATAYFVQISPKLEITGRIANLKQFSGKYPSSQFDVVSDSSKQPIHADYNGSRLSNGATVRVRFVKYDHTLLALTVLDGEDQGWELRESSGVLSCWLLSLMGLAGFTGAWWQWRTMPTCEEDVPLYDTEQDQNTNEPDPGSMLNLH